MADEIKAGVPAEPTVKGPKVWKYVGPGSEDRKTEPMPLISNLPLDVKIPRLGTDARKWRADELPERYITYVIDTNKEAKGWWK